MSESAGPLFSLPVDEGAGALLCLAGGDSAGGASPNGYSSIAQQAVVLSYHLLRHGIIDREVLAGELAAMDGGGDDPSVFRGESDDLRRWLDSTREGEPVLSSAPSAEPAARVAPVGIWWRRDPDGLVAASLETARLTHLDGPSAVVATAAAGAVAAACFAQNGRDLLMAVAEVAAKAAETVAAQDFRFSRLEDMGEVVVRIRDCLRLLGEAPEVISDQAGPDAVGTVIAAVTMAAPVGPEPEAQVEAAARVGGSISGALAGAVVGARTGTRRWPWDIPNDTWFVAIGQRLVAGETSLDDLPVPYAVEQRLTYSADARSSEGSVRGW